MTLAAWAVYHPGLNRVFIGDQVSYFAELEGDTSLVAGLRHYDYSLSRRYWKGDEALYRPLMYAWLAVANSLFGYHHRWWNMASLAIHVLVGFALFRLLTTIRPSPFALGFAVLFVVLKPSLGMVLLNHVGGYLLAALALTLALLALLQLLRRTRPTLPASPTVRYVLAASAAPLLHESMATLSLLALGANALVERRQKWAPSGRRTLVLILPLLLFLGLYAPHAARVERFWYVDLGVLYDHQGEGRALVNRTARNVAVDVARTSARWTLESILPDALEITVRAFEEFDKTFHLRFDVRLIPGYLAAAATMAALVLCVSFRSATDHAPFILVALGNAAAYVVIQCTPPGRVYPVHFYPFFLPVLIAAYAALKPEQLVASRRAIVWAALAALITTHAAGTYEVTRVVGAANHEASIFFERVERFVDAHKHEPDFTFSMRERPLDVDPMIPLLEGHPTPDATPLQRRMSAILFSRYLQPAGGKYTFDW